MAEVPAAFEQRCISPDGVVRRLRMPNIRYAPSSRLVSRAPRRSRRDAGFHHGLLTPASTRSCCRGRQRGSSAPAGRGCWALAARDPEPSVGSLLAGGRPAVPLRGGAQRVRRRQASHRCARSRCGWCGPFTFFRRKYLTGFSPSPAGSSEQPSACPSGGLSRLLRAVRPPEGRKASSGPGTAA